MFIDKWALYGVLVDDTRVKLNNPDCDYINANHVKVCALVCVWVCSLDPSPCRRTVYRENTL